MAFRGEGETTADGITDVSSTADAGQDDTLGEDDAGAVTDSAGSTAPGYGDHSGAKTNPGLGEWADGAWTNKPGADLPTTAGDRTTLAPTGASTTTGSLRPKQKPSPGDREANPGGRDPSDTDANDSSTNANDGFDPSAENPGVSTGEVSDDIGHPDFGVDATDASGDSASAGDPSMGGGPSGQDAGDASDGGAAGPGDVGDGSGPF